MNEASTLAVNCHTSLCVLSHPKGERKKKKKDPSGTGPMKKVPQCHGTVELPNPKPHVHIMSPSGAEHC